MRIFQLIITVGENVTSYEVTNAEEIQAILASQYDWMCIQNVHVHHAVLYELDGEGIVDLDNKLATISLPVHKDYENEAMIESDKGENAAKFQRLAKDEWETDLDKKIAQFCNTIK